MPARFTDKTVADGFLGLVGGVNSGWDPELIPNNQLSFAWNCSVRGGFVTHRPGRARFALTYLGSVTALRVNAGKFQGASFYSPDQGSSYIVASISGRLFKFTLGADHTSTVSEITAYNQISTGADFVIPVLNGPVSITVTDTSNVRAGVDIQIGPYNFTVVSVDSATTLTVSNNDSTAPIGDTVVSGTQIFLWDVNPALRPQSWMTQAEKWLIVQDGQSVPLFWDGATTSRSAIETGQIQAGRMMAYQLNRVIKANPDGRTFSIGDIAYGSSGTAAYQKRDAVLYVKENAYLAGGGFFTVPGGFGDITFIQPVAVLDASLGQGPAQVGTSDVIFSLNLPTDRTTWQNLTNPILGVSQITNGGQAQNSTLNINGDLFYRAIDGVRSFIQGVREFQTRWGNTPVSREMNRVMASDQEDLLPFGSAAVYDNRLLMTISPVYSNRGVFHRGLASLDLDVLGSMQEKLPPVWEGAWLGVNTLQVLSGKVDGKERCFEFVLTGSGELQLWEIDKDLYKDRENVPIRWAFETASMFRKGKNFDEMDLKKLLNGELHVDDVRGRVDFNVYYRPDQHPCWFPWHAWFVCQDETSCELDADTLCVKNNVFKPAYKARMSFGEPTNACDEQTGAPPFLGRTFQIRVEVMGHCKIRGMRLFGVLEPEEFYGPIECSLYEEVPLTTYWNVAVTEQAFCPSATPYGTAQTATIAANTYSSTESQEAANQKARDAAKAAAEAALTCSATP